MAVVYCKFKSSKDFQSIPVDGRFISVSDFKAEIFASKFYGNGEDFDLLISDAKTDQQYTDLSSFIPAYSSLLIRRIPGIRQSPIVVGEEKPKIQNIPSSVVVKDSVQDEEGFDCNDFGVDFKSIFGNSTVNPRNTHCKEEKIDGGFKISPVKRFGKCQFQIPPVGYVCRRCKVAGHYIQNCPTNGDPKFDFKMVKPTTWNSKASSSNSASTSTGGSGISMASSASTSSGSFGENIPPELYCPLCKQVMKDASLTKCCFASFCNKCIRDHIVSNSICVCQRKIVADYVLPNMTLRDTITRIMNLNQRGDTSFDNAGSEAANLKRKRLLAEKEPHDLEKLDLGVTEQSLKKIRAG